MIQILAAPPEVWGAPEMNEDDNDGDPWIARIKAFMQVAEGAYSVTVMTRNAVYAIRDPLGLRPLSLGQLDDSSFTITSETCALHTIGATFLRDVNPGEIVRLDKNGLHSYIGVETDKCSMCIFEHVYFARPDSILDGQVVHQVRQRMGRQLALESPVKADIVIGIPDSATPHSIGYSLESGIPYTEGLAKNRYIGRTFIQPDDDLRKEGIRIKYNPITSNLKGKRVILVDDSIIRGNTAGSLVQLIRDAGATEVHMRVASPPVRHPCFMGLDMATYSQLIAHRLDTEQIRERIGADSLAYLSVEGLKTTVNTVPHCNACFSGEYPTNIPE